MYPGENPLLNLLNPTNATESKENGQMPVLNPIELLNFFSNRAIIERLYQIRINLEAQVLSLQNDIQTMDTQLKEKKKLLSKKQSTPDGVKNDPHEEKSENTEKRTRRKARDVERSHVCPVTSCNKSYGSGASLYLHIRLKHSTSDLQQYKENCVKTKKLSDEASTQGA